jgi:hypothetical protein
VPQGRAATFPSSPSTRTWTLRSDHPGEKITMDIRPRTPEGCNFMTSVLLVVGGRGGFARAPADRIRLFTVRPDGPSGRVRGPTGRSPAPLWIWTAVSLTSSSTSSCPASSRPPRRCRAELSPLRMSARTPWDTKCVRPGRHVRSERGSSFMFVSKVRGIDLGTRIRTRLPSERGGRASWISCGDGSFGRFSSVPSSQAPWAR